MHNIDENEVLRDALSGLNDEVPPMPEGLHAAWMQKIEDDQYLKRMEQTRTRKTITRFLSIAAAMVFVVGGTLLTRDDLFLKAKPQENGVQKSILYTSAAANGAVYADSAAYDAVAEENESFSLQADTEPELRSMLAMTAGAGADTGAAMKSRNMTEEKKIIRNARLTIQTQRFDWSLDTLKRACEQQGGWIESSSESLNSSTGLRTASLTLRIPQNELDAYLDGAEALGRITSRSESAEDVTASYQDTQARLDTQLALMERLQALITASADLSDLLALESQIADTQYQIDNLTRSLNRTDRQVAYSTVTVALREEKTVELTDDTVTFGERLLSAVQVGAQAFVGFLGDAVVFLVAALPFIVIVGVIALIVIVIKRRKK